jgi:hypothetical protein
MPTMSAVVGNLCVVLTKTAKKPSFTLHLHLFLHKYLINNETSKVGINFILRSVRVTNVATEKKQIFQILIVCL